MAAFLNYRAVKKYTRVKLDINQTIIKPIIAVITMGISVTLIYKYTHLVLGNSVSTLLTILLGAIIYFIMLLIIGGITLQEMILIPGGKSCQDFIKTWVIEKGKR